MTPRQTEGETGAPTNLKQEGGSGQFEQTLSLGEPRRVRTIPRWLLLLGGIMGQAVLARVVFLTPKVGMVQAGALLALAAWGLLRRDAELSLLVAAYLTSAEIVWRQAQAPIPYLTGPYLVTIIGVISVFTVFSTLGNLGRRALLYIALLLPSSIITFTVAASDSRQLFAFALAGPTALAVLIVWLAQVRVSASFYRRVLWTVAISGVGPLTIGATNLSDSIGSGQDLVFTDASNFTASGGFGPVQVSSVLGLTVVVAILLVILETDPFVRLVAAAVGIGAAVQSLLTFSRGGMFSTAFAVAALALALARNREGRRRVLTVIAIVFALGYFVIIPRIDSFTKGAFNERFTDTKSGRTELASNDVEVFRQHFVFGVGPGMAKFQRVPYDICRLRTDRCKNEASSHTEFTRMLSEHGIPGLAAIVVLVSLAISATIRAGRNRPLAVTFLTFAIAQMFYANIRVVAVAFAFAFAFLRVGPPEEPDAETDEPVAQPLSAAEGIRPTATW